MAPKSSFNILKYHSGIIETLDKYIEERKIPNIIFHGEYGSGKKTILSYFLNRIYEGVQKKEYIMNVNCAHNKGIQFIRNELKFFAKTHMNENNNNYIKSIILLNAEYLTVDAQSALRRSIELFSKNTRFFIVVENKEKLLKPIISRFCDIYISKPLIGTKQCHLSKLNGMYQPSAVYNTKNKNVKNLYIRIRELMEQVYKINIDLMEDHNNGTGETSVVDETNGMVENMGEEAKQEAIGELYKNFKMFEFIQSIYEKGIYATEFIDYIIQHEKDTQDQIYNIELKCYYDKIKTEYTNEKLLLFHILNKYVMRNVYDLENIDTL